MELQPITEAGRRFIQTIERAEEEIRAHAAAHDRDASFPVEGFEALQRGGTLAAFAPVDLGGFGLDSVRDWAIAMERLGRADASLAIALNMHLGITRTLVQRWQSLHARQDPGAAGAEGIVHAVASGDLVICATATEPGTDFLRPRTTATPTDDGWSIEGRKIFVTLSPVANLCAVNVRIPATTGGPDQIGFAFVPMASEGVLPQDDWDALGMRGSGSQSVVFEDCRVPASSVQVVGTWGEWNPGLLMGRTLANITLAGAFLGIAERARSVAVEGAKRTTKPKFDGAIANASGVQRLLGEIDIDLAASRAILSQTTTGLDDLLRRVAREGPSLEDAHGAMRDYQCAKWVVNQNAIRIVSNAMDVCGGGAFMAGHELSRLYRDVRAGPFMQPFSPTEAQEYIGQVALGQPPLG